MISTTESVLYDVSFSDPVKGWVVGEAGLIMKSADRGRTWTAQASGTTQELYALQMSSATAGWAVGAKRTVVKYDGTGWTASQISHPVDLNFTGVRLVGTGTIIITSASGFSGAISDFRNLFYSRDSGASWSSLTIRNTAEASYILNYLYSSYFVDANIGYAVGFNSALTQAGKVFKTADGGATWSDVSPVGADNIAFRDAYFSDANTGWVAGGTSAAHGYIYHTTDGGATWGTPYDHSPALYRRVAGNSASDIWASDHASLYNYDGSNWAEYTTPLGSGSFYSVNFPDPWNGYAVGGLLLAQGGPKRYIYKYVVDPYELTALPVIYISATTYEANIALAGANIESNAVFTLEAAAGLTVITSEVKYDATLRKNKIDVKVRVDPAAARGGTYNFTLANPDEGTGGSGTFTLREATSPGTRPQATGLGEGVFDPITKANYTFQVQTPGAVTASGARTSAVAADVELELIVYSMSTRQILYRRKFFSSPSGYTNVTLQNVNDLGFHPSDGIYRAEVFHPQFGKIGGGEIVVHNSR